MTRLLIALIAVTALLALGACSGGEQAREDPENPEYFGFLTNVPETIPIHEYTGRCHAEKSCVESALDIIQGACEDDLYCVSGSINLSRDSLCGEDEICIFAIAAYDYDNLCGHASQKCVYAQAEEVCKGDHFCHDLYVEASLWLETINSYEQKDRCNADRSCVMTALDELDDECNDSRYCLTASLKKSGDNLCGDDRLCLLALLSYDYENRCVYSEQDCLRSQTEEICDGDESCYEEFEAAYRWLTVNESSPSEPGDSDDQMAASYVEDLYGGRVASLEDASGFIRDYWFEVFDSQLAKLERLGYEPFALRPGCLLASDYLFRQIRLSRASSFESMVAQETQLVETLQLIEENADEVVEGNLPPDVDKGWCHEIEDDIRQEYNAMPPP